MGLRDPTRRDFTCAARTAMLAAPFVLSGRFARGSTPTRLRFLTSWYAQAEHGGFYQALATGLYEKAGLDVDIRMGGPQVNAMQLLTGGDADLIMGYDIQTLNSIEKGLPVITVGTSFQFDLQGVMTHPDITGIAELKGRKILVASSAYTTYWPWLRQRFGFTNDQAAPYTFNLQPFLADPRLAQQAYPSSEPYLAQKLGAQVRFFLFAKDGYPPYGSTIVTMRGLLQQNPAAVAAFVQASMVGWKSYLADPAPGNRIIRQQNPKMPDGQIAFGIASLKSLGAVDGGDAATQGIGIMTEDRWRQTYDFMVQGGLLKPATNWRDAFTLKMLQNREIMLR